MWFQAGDGGATAPPFSLSRWPQAGEDVAASILTLSGVGSFSEVGGMKASGKMEAEYYNDGDSGGGMMMRNG
ncbi:hypothetical protein LINGRAHAP2_LOCUS30697 [Linum grandiflorum]